MAESQTSDTKDVQKAIQQYAGESFLVTTAHVARELKGGRPGQKQVVSIEGGRLVSELKGDEKLTTDEVEDLTKRGAIRPATVDDIRAGHARASAKEAEENATKRTGDFNALDAEQGAERQAIIEKHNAARDKELAALGEKHAAAREKLEKKHTAGTSK